VTAIVMVLLGAALLAWANGANDVSKGIATLVGSGVTGYRQAMLWGAAWTGLGAAAATLVTGAMLATFGSGLLGAGVTPSLAAAVAAIGGSAGWVLFATRTGRVGHCTRPVGGLGGYAAGVSGARRRLLRGDAPGSLIVPAASPCRPALVRRRS
jgi:PiT family inorganic phosphate transporter